MFGFRSAVPTRTHSSLVAAENALADQSQQHPDGWGIGWFVDNDAYMVKSSNAAHACERFERVSGRLTSHTFVVHVRRATVGVVDPVNAHPFRYGRWLFAHNGTLFSFDKMLPYLMAHIDSDLLDMIVGDTDSEHLFYFVLSRLRQAGADRSGHATSNADTVAAAVRSAAFDLDQEARRLGLERPIINILITDGRLMVAHKAGMPLWLSTQKSFCKDFPTCPAVKVCMEQVRPSNAPVNHFLVASERIGENENIWEEVDDGQTWVLDANFWLRSIAAPEGWTAPEMPERFKILAKPTAAT